METKRLFVGNIGYLSENDLQKAFGRYGTVQSVELKTKENLVDPDNPIHFAFISIEIDDFSLNKCLNRFSEKDLNGQFLNVSVARESFLDKLKKEREGNQKKDQKSSEWNEYAAHESQNRYDNKSKHNSFPSKNSGKKKTFDSDDEIFEEKPYEEESGKPLDDNEKRLRSLKRMQDAYNQNKNLIQQALSGVTSVNAKKIKFEQYESDEEKPKKKVELFGNSDSEAEEIDLKAAIKNKKKLEKLSGNKASNVTSQIQTDDRFKMNKQFLEGAASESESDSDEDDEKIENNEKESQLRIMEEIVGHKLSRPVDPNRKKFSNTIMRYDPKNAEHQEIVESMKSLEKEKKKKTKNEVLKDDEEELGPTKQEEKAEVLVSKEQFYSVNDELKKSLKSRGDGFSLLSMFGRQTEDSEQKNEIIHTPSEKILVKAPKKPFLDISQNPFKFDSSDSEEEEEQQNENANKTISNSKPGKAVKGKNKDKTVKPGVWIENFFITDKDKRLEEGAEFFSSRKPKPTENSEDKQDYGKVMEKLRLIINNKIKRSKKSMEGKHVFKKKQFGAKKKFAIK